MKNIFIDIFFSFFLLFFIAVSFWGCDDDPLGDGVLSPRSNNIVFDAYSSILATNCDPCVGADRVTEDNENFIGNYDDGDYVVFENVDFGTNEDAATHIVMEVGTIHADSQIEVIILNKSVATETITDEEAQGWTTFVATTNQLSETIYGKHDVRLISRGSPKNLRQFFFLKDNN